MVFEIVLQGSNIEKKFLDLTYLQYDIQLSALLTYPCHDSRKPMPQNGVVVK